MPIYVYHCPDCNAEIEERRARGDHRTECPDCGGRVRQVYQSFRFKFATKPYSVESSIRGESVREEMRRG